MMNPRLHRTVRGALLGFMLGLILDLGGPGACATTRARADPLEPARAALRTLQFSRAIELLSAAGTGGNPEAQYLLGLMYLNGVGIVADPVRARALLQSAADHGQGAAAYVLASELAHDPHAPPDAARHWLERSAQLGYGRAREALKAGGALLAREDLGASDPALRPAWVIACIRRNDTAELRRLGAGSISARDAFGRGSLDYAVQADAVDAATTLLQLGDDLHATDTFGTTALMLAAERSDHVLLELLLQHGADPQAIDAEHRTALFYAARANQPQAIAALRAAGARLDARDEHGYNALDAALAVNATAAAQALRDSGLQTHVVATAPARGGKFDPARPGDIYPNWPALALAVARDDTTAIRQLLDTGALSTLRPPPGESLLQIAVDARALDALALLAHGASITATDHAGHTALWLAAARGDLAVIRALLAAGVAADTHAVAENTPLLAALHSAHAEAAQALLDAGANQEAIDAQGRRPLMIAGATRQLPLVQWLLAHHVQVDAQDPQRRTALWYSVAMGSAAEVNALIRAGARPDVVDAQGQTVLHAAAAQGDAAVVQPLLAVATSLNQRSVNGGDTPLLIAAARGHAELVRELLKLHPDLDVQNHAGDTALLAAARGGHAAVCQLLLAAGSNTALRNVAGVTAAEVAQGRGFTSLARDLTSKTL
jgi:ankyrin repeat protein